MSYQQFSPIVQEHFKGLVDFLLKESGSAINNLYEYDDDKGVTKTSTVNKPGRKQIGTDFDDFRDKQKALRIKLQEFDILKHDVIAGETYRYNLGYKQSHVMPFSKDLLLFGDITQVNKSNVDKVYDNIVSIIKKSKKTSSVAEAKNMLKEGWAQEQHDSEKALYDIAKKEGKKVAAKWAGGRKLRKYLGEVDKSPINVLLKNMSEGKNTPFGILYYEENDVIYIISPNYNVLKDFLGGEIKNYLRKELKLAKSHDIFNLGHTMRVEDSSDSLDEDHRSWTVAAARSQKLTKSLLDLADKADNSKEVEKYKAHLITAYNKTIREFEKLHKEIPSLNLNLKTIVEFDKDIKMSGSSIHEALGSMKFTIVYPQGLKLNQTVLGAQEDKILKSFKEQILTMPSSKTIASTVLDGLKNIFLGKKTKNYKSKTVVKNNIKIKSKTRKPKNTTVKAKKAINDLKKKRKKKSSVVLHNTAAFLPQLRTPGGQYTSVVHIAKLLEPLVQKMVKVDMDSASYFKTLTGRFTKSVELEDIIQADRSVVVKYNYLKNPYTVFNSGGRLHRNGRSPEDIIGKSIRAAAATLVSNKFNIVPQVGR